MKIIKKSGRLAFFGLVVGLGLMLGQQAASQTFRNLHSFTSIPNSAPYTNSDGAGPYADLIASGNTLYGTSSLGGSAGNGTVFAINSDGTGFTNLHSFTKTAGSQNTNSDGVSPFGALVLSGDTLYGTSLNGGKFGSGTVFAINTDGTQFRNLHNFAPVSYMTAYTNSDGANPRSGLVVSSNTLYGTTTSGGRWASGVVFALNTDGTSYTNLHAFTQSVYDSSIGASLNADGAVPEGRLILAGNKLYGSALGGGSSGNGTLFAVNTDGTGFARLHDFSGFFDRWHTNSDGASPQAGLIISGDTLYGTASYGGTSGSGAVFRMNTDGSGFTNLHSFTGIGPGGLYAPSSDGDTPYGGLVLVTNTLYGTTYAGGTTNNAFPYPQSYGTVFAVNTDGTGFTPLYRFSSNDNTNNSNPDGARPWAGLIVISNALYGTTQGGGSFGSGTIYSVPAIARAVLPPPGQFGDIYADFTTAVIGTANMTITPGAYFTYNTNFPGSWDIAAESFGFSGTFAVPSTGLYQLTVNHQTSAASTCSGGGYSPVNISVNGTQIASNFDPAQNSGGSLGEVTNSWVITATAGSDNTLQWTAGHLCSRYWIQGIQITSVPLPILNLSVASNNVVLFWNTNLSGFVLESSTNLGGVWAQVSPPPTLIGATNFMTNSLIRPSQFYRLHNLSGQ